MTATALVLVSAGGVPCATAVPASAAVSCTFRRPGADPDALVRAVEELHEARVP